MNDEAQRVIRDQFLSLLPKTLNKELVDTFMGAADNYPNSFAAAVYEAATYAGWCRGYAEGKRAESGACPKCGKPMDNDILICCLQCDRDAEHLK